MRVYNNSQSARSVSELPDIHFRRARATFSAVHPRALCANINWLINDLISAASRKKVAVSRDRRETPPNIRAEGWEAAAADRYRIAV